MKHTYRTRDEVCHLIDIEHYRDADWDWWYRPEDDFSDYLLEIEDGYYGAWYDSVEDWSPRWVVRGGNGGFWPSYLNKNSKTGKLWKREGAKRMRRMTRAIKLGTSYKFRFVTSWDVD